jgi:hypothetical protein
MKRFNQLPLVTFFLACASVAGLALAADGWRRSPTPPDSRPFAPPDQWDCRDVVSHLQAHGLEFRAVSTAEHGPCDQNVFLTKTAKTWAELNGTRKVVERLDDWRGTVYCEKIANPGGQDVRFRLWREGGLQLGTFLFFGDPALLAEIAAALARPAPGLMSRATCV